MAVEFLSASSEYLEQAYGPITAAPITISGWVNMASYTDFTNYTLISVMDTAYGNGWSLKFSKRGTDQGRSLFETIQSGSNGQANGVNKTVATDTWYHVAGYSSGAASRYAYWGNDDSLGAENTTSLTPSGVNRLTVSRYRSSPTEYMNGRIAELGVWNVVLSRDELRALADGYSPLLIRPSALKIYIPLVDNSYVNRHSGVSITENGTPTTYNHPAVIHPQLQSWSPPPQAASPVPVTVTRRRPYKNPRAPIYRPYMPTLNRQSWQAEGLAALILHEADMGGYQRWEVTYEAAIELNRGVWPTDANSVNVQPEFRNYGDFGPVLEPSGSTASATYVEFPVPDKLWKEDKFTLTSWVVASTEHGPAIWPCIHLGGIYDNDWARLDFSADAGNVRAGYDGAASQVYSVTDTNQSPGEVYHIAATFDKSDLLRVYVNAVEIRTADISGCGALTEAQRIIHSVRNSQAGIAESRYYHRVLSPDEIWLLWTPETRWDLYLQESRITYKGARKTMGRMYSVNNTVASLTTAADMIEINAPSDAIVVLHSVHITQETEFGDAQAEMLDFLIHRGSTSGSAGATPTAAPLEAGDAAFGGTVETGNTTQGTEGTVLHRETAHVAAGLHYVPTPEERIVISPGGRLIVELGTAPDDSIDLRVAAVFEEIGG